MRPTELLGKNRTALPLIVIDGPRTDQDYIRVHLPGGSGQRLGNPKVKAQEKAARGRSREQGTLAGVPVGLPALTRALKLQAKASQVGFDWTDPRAVLRKIREEADEIEEALDRDQPSAAAEVGDLLFAAVNLARHRAPIRKRCCGRPTRNSSAAFRQ